MLSGAVEEKWNELFAWILELLFNLLPVAQRHLPLLEHCDGVGVSNYLEIELHFCIVNHDEVKNR
jgi:hypothetical protein